MQQEPVAEEGDCPGTPNVATLIHVPPGCRSKTCTPSGTWSATVSPKTAT